MKLSGHKIQAISKVGAPTISISTYTNTSITIAWTNRTEPLISYYSVYYSTSQNGTYTKANNANNTTTGPYLISGLTQGLTYYIYIRAVDFSGNLGPASNIVSQALTTFNIPSISFTQGQSSNHSLSQYYTIPPGQSFVSLTLVQGNLESGTSGLTLNSGAQTLVYDGVGLPATKSGLVIRLTTNIGTIDSTLFSVTVNPASESLTWLSDPFPMTIAQGSSIDLRPYYSDSESALGSIDSIGTPFPTGVTVESSPYWRVEATAGATLGQSGGGHQLRLTPSTEIDWQNRISDPSVVWYHDFESSNEVTNFRWGTTIGSGNDPNGGATKSAYVRRIATDGIRGSCMEIIRPANNGDDSIHWIRPMAPMFSGTTTGNGRTSNDPAANGSLTRRAWSPTQGGNQTVNFGYGWYQHPNYQTADSDGHDFYVQLRVKMDPRRITGGNDAFGVGKFIWFTLCQTSLTTQEHVIWSYGYGGNDTGTKNYFRVYVHSVVGNAAFAPLDTGQSRIQPGNQSATDFSYSGGWDCLLIRIRPGVEGTTTGTNATQLQVWAATEAQIRAGQGYTASTKKIYDFTYGLSDYYGTSSSEYGFQALMLSGYNNGASFPQEFYHRYCQVIFSKAFIDCPTW